MQKKPASKPKQTQAELRKQLVTASKKLEQFQREQKIEAALDSVRSRALAMRESSELREVVAVLYQKLQELEFGIDQGAALVMTFTPDSNDHTQWITDASQSYTIPFFIPFTRHSISRDQINARKKGLSFLGKIYNQKEKNEYFKHLFQHTEYKHLPRNVQKLILNSKKFGISIAFEKHAAIAIPSTFGTLVTADEKIILKRFAKVFEQCYTRFLDLQKAEAQAREAQIEAALEKVRSRSHAMRQSHELSDIVLTVYNRLNDLGFNLSDGAVAILEFEAGSRNHTQWIVDPYHTYPTPFKVPYTDHALCSEIFKARAKGVEYLSRLFTFGEKNDYFKFLFAHNPDYQALPKDVKKFLLSSKKYGISVAFSKHSAILIPTNTGTLLSDEKKDILIRFSKVFDQAYTRFLDLQKAEAQAREAQIEAALEKIRSRSQAMHHSDEISEVIGITHKTLAELNVKHDTIAFQIFEFDKNSSFFWPGNNLQVVAPKVILPYDEVIMKEDTCHRDLWEAMANGEAIINKVYTKAQKDRWFEYVFAHNDSTVIESHARHFILQSEIYTVCFFPEKKSGLFADSWDGTKYTQEDIEVLKRAARVFEQAYVRFLDLQKAEAQAREAQIQLALERVRARTMAMQHSHELAEAAKLLYQQFHSLGIKSSTCAYMFIDEEKQLQRGWAVAADGSLLPDFFDFPLTGDAILDQRYTSWKQKRPLHEASLKGRANKRHHQYLVSLQPPEFGKQIVDHLPDEVFFYNANFSHGYLFIVNTEQFTTEEKEIAIRFAKVFEQTYTRFLDLQKAEAQAREAQIETALERVRSRSMGMQRVDDMKAVIKEVYEQLKWLGFKSGVAAINIMDAATGDMDIWMEGLEDGYDLPERYHVPYFDHPGHNQHLEHWKNGNSYAVIEISGPDKKSYDNYFFFHTGFAKVPENTRNLMMSQESFTSSMAYMKYGAIGWAPAMLDKEQVAVLQRFAKVFEQTYTRFLDLQKAEAQAKEAIKQSSLDRVRGEIASMRPTADLDRITPLIWRELTTLSIPFSRCGVFIMDEAENQIHTFLSTPDGDAIAAFKLPMDNPGNLEGAVEHWRHHQVFVMHWVDQDFQAQADLLMQLGAITSRNQYLSKVPDGGIYLHLLPFMHGMLYVGNTAPLSEDELNLVQSLADAFSVAYARYEDFRQLELAKKEVDKAFTELKQAQQQLVQSEKMASLGELTAGIAHEIQNPLNFVNNFSEVSNELIKEIQDLRQKTHEVNQDTEEDMLLKDIASNLEKINFHGKRADAIVKSMLQHSRTSSGKKELTDINVLCDEYLRLAYHGYRAKDKSFNAKFESQLDPSLPKVNVMAQDIGRVVLNLINNAFYAVNAKARLQAEGFMPQVTVVTRKLDSTIEISVKDNGNGIPDSIKEKIFQPFFTTKPTGQGTGLGLSLAYDIVTKGHGGELRVETEEGKGTAFIINLPVL
jgi:signal transduction histidine kinase